MRVNDPVLAELRAAFGKDAVTTLKQGGLSRVSEWIPTGLDTLDYRVLGGGGLPVGRVVEVAGEEGVGKTSIVLTMMGAALQAGCRVLFIDAENSCTSGRAEQLGVDPSRINLLEPDTIQDVVRYVRVATRTPRPNGPPTLIVWDSLAETPIAEEASVDADDGHKALMGIRGRIMSEMMRVEKRRLARSRTTLVVVNQLRKKMGVVFGDPWTSPGGDALKYAAYATIRLTRGKSWKVNDKRVGTHVHVIAIKNKAQAPWHPVQLRLHYQEGYQNAWATVELAVRQGVLKPAGKGGYRTPRGKTLDKSIGLERMAAVASRYLWGDR